MKPVESATEMSENCATEEVTRGKFNVLKKYYDQTWDKENHTLHVGVFENPEDSLVDAYRQASQLLVKKLLEQKPIREDSNILDIGCGAGRTLIEICEQYSCNGTGVDLSDEQIKDAKSYLNMVNEQRLTAGLKSLSVDFIRCSASELDKQFTQDEIFSHVISQDAILLVANKLSLFENIHRLLQPSGTMVVADFLAETKENSLTESEPEAIYKFVNWTNGLSTQSYQKLLQEVGLNVIETEIRDQDMIKTYAKLAKEINPFITGNDAVYQQLKDRYEKIVEAIKEGEMGWAFFTANKSKKKVALLAGTKLKSIGRAAAEQLKAKGWEIWLYGRSAENKDDKNWHERSCDLTSEESVRNLLAEISSVDLSVFLADSGGAKGDLSDLDIKEFQDSLNTKIMGSVLLCQQLANKVQPGGKTKLVWCAGKTGEKSKELLSYGIINSSIEALVQSLNKHYKEIFDCYYLETPLISPSSLGDKYIAEFGNHLEEFAYPPSIVCEKIEEITEDKHEPGYVKIVKDAL